MDAGVPLQGQKGKDAGLYLLRINEYRVGTLPALRGPLVGLCRHHTNARFPSSPISRRSTIARAA